jgi:hypothetical protein
MGGRGGEKMEVTSKLLIFSFNVVWQPYHIPYRIALRIKEVIHAGEDGEAGTW